MRRRLALPAAVLLACGSSLLLIGGVPAHADDFFSGTSTAEATGERITYSVPNYLVINTLVDEATPISQSTLGSGNAQGFASLPYPGDTVVNAGALADVATGQNLPYSYPLYVVATDPLTPTAHAQDGTGTVVLDATAAPSKVTGTASADNVPGSTVNAAGSVTDTSVVTGADGTVVSTADSVVRGIDAGIVSIGEVHTHSVTTLAPGAAKPTTVTSTTVSGATADGMTIGIGPSGITLGPAAVGAPYQPVLDAINTALSAQGVSLHTLGTTPVSGGSSTSGLEIDQTSAVPVPGNPQGIERTVLGETTTDIVAGESFGSGNYGDTTDEPVVTGGTEPATGSTTGPGSAITGAKPVAAKPIHTSTPLSTAPTPAAPVAASGGGTTAGTTLAAGSGPATSSDLPPPVAAGAAPPLTQKLTDASGNAAPRAEAFAVDFSGPLNFFYLVIVLGAGAVFVASLIWRAKGVRAIWTS